MRKQVIGVDLDGSLARHYSEYGPYDPMFIGEPIPEMVNRVKRWLAEGVDVQIFTARVAPPEGEASLDSESIVEARNVVKRWALMHIGALLPVTCVKGHRTTAIYDDIAYRVERNTGVVIPDPDRQASRVVTIHLDEFEAIQAVTDFFRRRLKGPTHPDLEALSRFVDRAKEQSYA